MIAHQVALIRRELWEHRSIWVTPAVIAVVVTLGTLTALMFAGEFAEKLDLVLFGAQNVAGDTERRALLTGVFVALSWPFVIALGILTIFYALDSLYAERKDKSILFWRSLPVTDAETVISKLVTALILIPAVALLGVFVTHLLNLIVSGIWVSMKGGDAGHLIWSSTAFVDNWLAAIVFVFAGAIWMSPFVGWFLFVSAYTKRAPILLAFIPLVVLPLLEGIFTRSSEFAQAVLGRGPRIPIFKDIDLDQFFDEDHEKIQEGMVTLLGHLDVVKFLTSLETWLGIAVCALLVTGAIYVRRFRDES